MNNHYSTLPSLYFVVKSWPFLKKMNENGEKKIWFDIVFVLFLTNNILFKQFYKKFIWYIFFWHSRHCSFCQTFTWSISEKVNNENLIGENDLIVGFFCVFNIFAIWVFMITILSLKQYFKWITNQRLP